MVQLDAGYASVSCNRLGQPALSGYLLIAPQAEISPRKTSIWRYRGSLQNDQRRAAEGSHAVMGQVIVIDQAVARCRVLTHRRQHDAVPKLLFGHL